MNYNIYANDSIVSNKMLLIILQLVFIIGIIGGPLPDNQVDTDNPISDNTNNSTIPNNSSNLYNDTDLNLNSSENSTDSSITNIWNNNNTHNNSKNSISNTSSKKSLYSKSHNQNFADNEKLSVLMEDLLTKLQKIQDEINEHSNNFNSNNTNQKNSDDNYNERNINSKPVNQRVEDELKELRHQLKNLGQKVNNIVKDEVVIDEPVESVEEYTEPSGASADQDNSGRIAEALDYIQNKLKSVEDKLAGYGAQYDYSQLPVQEDINKFQRPVDLPQLSPGLIDHFPESYDENSGIPWLRPNNQFVQSEDDYLLIPRSGYNTNIQKSGNDLTYIPRLGYNGYIPDSENDITYIPRPGNRAIISKVHVPEYKASHIKRPRYKAYIVPEQNNPPEEYFVDPEDEVSDETGIHYVLRERKTDEGNTKQSNDGKYQSGDDDCDCCCCDC